MKALSRLLCSVAEFGNKVQSCGTEDAKIFYCYIGSNLYAEDRVEYYYYHFVPTSTKPQAEKLG